MHARVIGILVLTLFIGCQWLDKVLGRVKTSFLETLTPPPHEDPEVISEKAAEEVSRVMGIRAEEIKELSKEDLDKIAVDAKNSAASASKSTMGSTSQKDSELVDNIQRAVTNFELAFKSLVGASYYSSKVTPVLLILNNTSQKLELASELAKILEERGDKHTLDEIKKIVRALDGDVSFCLNDLEARIGLANAVEVGLKKCIKRLLNGASTAFYESAHKELSHHLEDAPDKFKGALKTLQSAALDIYNASLRVALKYS
ncbi:hypothetical protein [Borrelia sp. P9F1]|uniref:hypothetical protein n=1 Tax=Borrelia sp. P9F1 TaxID=3058374 RepID=UPI002647454F|nr:hypothetical protein [Borrelia sp. P9F1]WKC58514.1 hypothetical protein QYZ68_04665 [Borrelia sp. P9F1]